MASRFPVYQVDFQAVASGKVVASSKRKVRWRFGFPNQQALAAGRTGVDCRGEEHDIVLIWSIASGKRQVYFDGREVHFSTSRSQTFSYSWSAKGNHVIKVVAYAAAPASPLRQFDLHIDGQSFFHMPKAFELGIRGPIPAHDRVPGSRGFGAYDTGTSRPGTYMRAPDSREQEEADLQKAISASLQESKHYLAGKEAPPAGSSATNSADLMDLTPHQQPGAPHLAPPGSQSLVAYSSMPPTYGAPPQYPPPMAAYAPTNPSLGYAHSTPPHGGGAPGQSYSSQPNTYALPPPAPGPVYESPSARPPQPTFAPSFHSGMSQSAPPQPTQPSSINGFSSVQGAPPPVATVPTGDLFAPPPVDPFAPAAPTAGNIFMPNQPVPPLDDPFAPRPPPPPSRDDITKSILNAYGPPSTPMQGQHIQAAGQAQSPANAQNTARIAYVEPAPEKPLSEFDQALKRLVNVERIDEPAEQEYKLTMSTKKDEHKTKDGKSKGLPPVAIGLVGSNASLDHIKKVKPDVPKTGEGVMKAPPQLFHPDAVNAGALVVHGQGPPPIQRGFGIGFGTPPPNFQQRNW